jgi:hypothetical protein
MFWLTWADSVKARMWCYMQAEFDADPEAMSAARIGQLRILGSELGMDSAGRQRIGTKPSGESKKKADASKYIG